MITPEYARVMARYNRWQNSSHLGAASKLTDEERWEDRGAFFGSIAQTLNHVLWDDRVWLARLRGDKKSATDIGARHPYTNEPTDWDLFVRERTELDAEIVAWADTLTEEDLARSVRWMRGDEEVETDFSFNVVHMMNHQTHHRGQVHAMLTAAGALPEPTDLQMLTVLEHRQS